MLDGRDGPFVAATDYMSLVPDQVARWVPGRCLALGTDGFGRSDTQPALREHFEVDARHIAFAALSALASEQKFTGDRLKQAQEELEIDSEKIDPATA